MAKCKIDQILEATAKHHNESHEESEFVAGLSPGEKKVYVMAELNAADGVVNTYTSAMRESLCPECRIKATCAA